MLGKKYSSVKKDELSAIYKGDTLKDHIDRIESYASRNPSISGEELEDLTLDAVQKFKDNEIVEEVRNGKSIFSIYDNITKMNGFFHSFLPAFGKKYDSRIQAMRKLGISVGREGIEKLGTGITTFFALGLVFSVGYAYNSVAAGELTSLKEATQFFMDNKMMTALAIYIGVLPNIAMSAASATVRNIKREHLRQIGSALNYCYK